MVLLQGPVELGQGFVLGMLALEQELLGSLVLGPGMEPASGVLELLGKLVLLLG